MYKIKIVKIFKKIILFLIILIGILLLYIFIFKKMYFTLKYNSPVYIYNGGVFGSSVTRCLCYGTKGTIDYGPASDPPSASYCKGWSDKSSCELKIDENKWSRVEYIRKIIQTDSFF